MGSQARVARRLVRRAERRLLVGVADGCADDLQLETPFPQLSSPYEREHGTETVDERQRESERARALVLGRGVALFLYGVTDIVTATPSPLPSRSLSSSLPPRRRVWAAVARAAPVVPPVSKLSPSSTISISVSISNDEREWVLFQ